jgi:hypothetical protein
MSEYVLVFWIWVLALLLDLAGIAAHVRHYWYLRPFRHYLRYASLKSFCIETNTVVEAWIRDAVYHLGLRILLAVMAVERILLQVTVPLEARAAFAASTFQLGLAIAFLAILVWLSLWTIRIQSAHRRGENEVFGMWFQPPGRS